jgi:hypothetical protein
MNITNYNNNNALNNILENKQQNFPIKEFLLNRSLLVQFNQKEVSDKGLTSTEKKKYHRIMELRDKVFSNINHQLARYFETITNSDYRYAGMPEMAKGIRG